ncbi:LAFA_0G14136g1_1 [Lachancea sp. 'fantastica']|nr:LAFA_0G14136g1_1 [Lachancea sp. 'fantastica']
MEALNIPPPVADWLFKVTQPYYDARTTFRDVMYTLSEFRNVRPRTKVFTDSQGKAQLLLCLYGRFQSDRVSVPVLIWIPKEYPILAPYIFVDFDALQDETIIPGGIVNSSGRFQLPLLDSWSPDSCCLRDLAFLLASMILENPPLVNLEPEFAQSPPLPERIGLPKLPNTVNSSGSEEIDQVSRTMEHVKLEDAAPMLPPKPPSAVPSSVPSALDSANQSGVQSAAQSVSPVRPPQPALELPNIMDLDAGSQHISSYDNALSHLRRLVVALAKEDRQNVEETLRTRMFAVQNATAQFENICDQEKTALDQKEAFVLERHASVSAGLETVRKQLDKAQYYMQNYGPACDLGSMLAPEAAGVKQLRHLVAQDHAVTDTINALGRMVNQNILAPDVFLRKVRSLARDQFLLRLHMNKITTRVYS